MQIRAQVISDKIITGQVINDSRLPISFATVVLKKASDSTIYNTVFCNSVGAFALNGLKDGSWFLEIAAVGYDRFVKNPVLIGNQDTVVSLGTIILQRSAKILSGVTVQSALPLLERTIDKTIVNLNNSISSEGTTVLEELKKLPGVQVTAEGQVIMNGRQGVNIYIDGKPSYLSAEDLNALLSGMQASGIQKIELITNPSSKYDAAGTAGIINIVKKKNRKEGLNGSINAGTGYGHFGRYNGGLMMSYKNKRFNLYMNNTYTHIKSFSKRSVTSDISDAGRTLINEQVSSNTGIGTGTYYRPTVGIDFYLSGKTTFSLSGTPGIGISDSRLSSFMDLADSNRKKTTRSFFSSALGDKPINYTVGASLVQRLDSSGKNISIDFDYARYNNKPRQLNSNTISNASGNFLSQSDELQQQRRQLKIYSVKADIFLPLKNKDRLETGIKSSYVKAANDNDFYNRIGTQNIFDSANSNYSINSEQIYAGYFNWTRSYKQLTVQAGVRAEQTIAKGIQLRTGESVNQNYLQLFPSLFLEYTMNGQNSFNSRFGRRIERAAYNELVPFRRPQTATLYFQGNPDLRPQTSWHGEFSWHYQQTFTITLNYDNYKDYIRTVPFSDSNKITITRTPINIKQAHSWDVDLLYSKKIMSWWQCDNTLSFYQNSFKGESGGFSLNNSGLVSAYLSINNSFQFNRSLSAECNFEYNSKRQYVTSTFGAYAILSFGIKRLLLNNNASLSFNVNNVLNSENHNAIDRTAGLYQYAYLYFYSRYASINFGYRFGKGKTIKSRVSSGAADEQKRAGN